MNDYNFYEVMLIGMANEPVVTIKVKLLWQFAVKGGDKFYSKGNKKINVGGVEKMENIWYKEIFLWFWLENQMQLN